MTVQGTEWMRNKNKNKNKKKHDITYPSNFDEAIENSVQKRVSQIHKHIEVRRFHSGIEVCLRHFVHDKNNLQQQFKSRVLNNNNNNNKGTDPNRSCSIWSITRSERASKAGKRRQGSWCKSQATCKRNGRTEVDFWAKKKKKTERTDGRELEWAAREKSFLNVRECHAGKTKGYSIWIDAYCSTRGAYL